jgi:hypothetical protein
LNVVLIIDAGYTTDSLVFAEMVEAIDVTASCSDLIAEEGSLQEVDQR